jgi:hypothetical protein
MQVVFRLLAIVLLKAGPQHLPYSVSLLASLTLLYMLSGILVLAASMSFAQAVANLMLDVVVLFAFSYFCLSLLQYKTRFVQTVAALTGIGTIYHLLAWPLFIQSNNMHAQQQDTTIIGWLMLLLISWQVLVFAHVFRHAMQMSMLRALVLSFGYLFLAIASAEMVFPGN